jgi:alpha-L-rhamnosidase
MPLKLLRSSLFLLLLLIASCSKNAVIEPVHLQTDGLVNPLGIDNIKPSFSWQISSQRTIVMQSAYHILVATKPELLHPAKADVWNSGWVMTDQSTGIPFKGGKLKSGANYYWCVKISDNAGNQSHWSEPATFEMALLHPSDWKGAQWIGMKEKWNPSEHRLRYMKTERMDSARRVESYPLPLLRKSFSLPTKASTARLYVTGVGYFEAWINGKKVGSLLLDPAPTSFDRRVFYRVYDVTPYLSKGKNALAIELANGFYGQNLAFGTSALQYGKPRAIARLAITTQQGHKTDIVTDTTWLTHPGPIVFENIYAGETHDQNYTQKDWNKVDCDTQTWKPAIIMESPAPILSVQTVEPIRALQTLTPKKIVQMGNKWIVDFGQNISGWVRLNVDEPAGSVVTIRMAEAMFRDSSGINTQSTGAFATGFEQIDKFVSEGTGSTTIEPRFTYKGFRYAEIEGLSRPLAADDIRAVPVHTVLNQTGSFNSSDALLNTIYNISLHTVATNMHGLPEDCPHREKCGWLGDAHAVSEFSVYTFDMQQMYRKYMLDITDNSFKGRIKTATGFQPKVPAMVAPGKRIAGEATLDWGIALQFIPYNVYLYYGDTSLYRQYDGQIRSFLQYMLDQRNEKGIVENGLGDWCPPKWDKLTNPDVMECHPYTSANALLYKGLRIAGEMALLDGDSLFAREMHGESDLLKEAFNTQWLVTCDTTGYFWYGSQTATIMALQYALVPDSLINAVLNGLLNNIIVTRGSHHNTGIHGHKHLYQLLSSMGHSQTAWDVLMNPTFPSMRYLVESGVTTWPERQFEYAIEEWNRSMNHPMHSGFASFFYQSIGGIKPDAAGFKKILFKPVFLENLEHASVITQSPYGEIVSKWQRNGDVVNWEIKIPHNSTAKIEMLPGYTITDCRNEKGFSFIAPNPVSTAVSLYLGSGSYKLVVVK